MFPKEGMYVYTYKPVGRVYKLLLRNKEIPGDWILWQTTPSSPCFKRTSPIQRHYWIGTMRTLIKEQERRLKGGADEDRMIREVTPSQPLELTAGDVNGWLFFPPPRRGD